MRRARVPLLTVSAAIVVAACSSCGGNAFAAGDVIVSPSQARPGSKVEIRTSKCQGTWAIARSEAFVAEARLAKAQDNRALWGEAQIRNDAQSRQYEVRVRCEDGGQATGSFSVVAHHPGPKPQPDPWRPDPWSPQPWRPVHAGGGGTAADKNADTTTLADERPSAAGYADDLALAAGLATLLGFAGHRLRRRGRR
ncbi:hypothetical protein SRB5_41050 [Streptomyces sp. RB5]|uniref:Lipoprotein n=1 Tax=Streptomyces smaragdinus TaxID=2585196 RepID=A0A7K0CKB5_9ACTN|nr:hypothetical protein [Streptomyces smaragdinus]MQY13945.1 hypothetical protein [Streptomyces smaragdinus]